jgi:uncharacterized protein YciI
MYFVVTRERGPAWDGSRLLREQDGWPEHAAFMEALVDEGFVLLGGPFGDGVRTLLIVHAASEEAIHERLAADPWTPTGFLRVVGVERWEVLLGELEQLRDRGPVARGRGDP